jgi:hypothetical protein
MTTSKTGLFSATVAAFIIEFYKKLSPDSGNQTVALLGQISQQFANFPNGTYSITANQPSPPSASIIWVNAMWLISLVLSLTSALMATLLQQWARRYVEMPNIPSEPKHRARIRLLLFQGTDSYKMHHVVEIAPTLLHLSVFLFFGGLTIVFHTIHKKVAVAVDVAVGFFGLAYIALSILPCRDVKCPYRTPMTYILWYPWHAFPGFVVYCFSGALFLLQPVLGCLVSLIQAIHLTSDNTVPEPARLGHLTSDNTVSHRMRPRRPGTATSMIPTPLILLRWSESSENHWRYFTDHIGKSIIKDSMNAQGDEDRRIVTGLFSQLALGNSKGKLRKFAASIPRYRVSDLMPLVDSGRIVLREPIAILLRSCVAGPNDSEDSDVRRRALLVCLDAIQYIVKKPSVPDLNFVRANFANISLMQTLWGDSDTAIRVTSRSICALLARQVAKKQLWESQLRWLQGVTGEASDAIIDATTVERDRMILKSFVYGVLSNQLDDFPTEDATSFKETLAILLNAGDDAHFQSRLAEEAGPWIQQDGDPQCSHEVVDKLRSMFPFLPAYRPPSPPAGTTEAPDGIQTISSVPH